MALHTVSPLAKCNSVGILSGFNVPCAVRLANPIHFLLRKALILKSGRTRI